jgi:uncharacterized protein YhaN
MALCVDLNNGIAKKFAQCLINTLLNLASAALQALKQVLTAMLVPVDLAIAQLMVTLAQYDLLAQQYKAAEAVIKATLDQIQNKLNGLPLGLLDPTCFEWANLNGGINAFLQNEIRPPIDQILFELERLTSFQSELQALKAEYEALKALWLDTIDVLDTLILEAKCREAAGIANPV